MFKGERLKELRLEKKLTQVQLAKLFNVTHSTITRYEKNIHSPDTDLVGKFADFFNVSSDYLLGRTDKRNEVVSTDADSERNSRNERAWESFLEKLIAAGIIKEGEALPEELIDSIIHTLKTTADTIKKNR